MTIRFRSHGSPDGASEHAPAPDPRPSGAVGREPVAGTGVNPATAAAALDAFDEPFFVVEDGRVTESNAAAASTFGELDGRPAVDLFDGTDADAVGRALDRAATSGDATVEANHPGMSPTSSN